MNRPNRRPATKSIGEMYGLDPAQVKADFDIVRAERQALTTTREQLAAELQTTTRAESQLLQQEQLLALVLRMHSDADNDVPGAKEAVAAYAAAAPLAREQSLSANVLTIVKQALGTPVQPAYVLARLNDEGIAADAKAVRTALRRWVARKMLAKDGPGYRYLEPTPPYA